mgnify:CR=1 FL=1|tara:strand:+ start:227 stop:904 length:678 start_codon:yes stop_codon:yes gene_type:complete
MPSQIQVDKIIDSGSTTNKELAEYSSSAWSWGSGVPANTIIKTYGKTFLGTQTVNTVNDNANVDYSDTPSAWVLIGTGASGANGDPLAITTDTPLSSSSKYLLKAFVNHSRRQSGSAHMAWWYRTAGSSDAFVPIVRGIDTGTSNWTRFAFGSGHNSTTSGSGNYGTRVGAMEYLWSPNSSNAFEIQIRMFVYSDVMYINRPNNSDAHNYMGNQISTFLIQEIAG